MQKILWTFCLSLSLLVIVGCGGIASHESSHAATVYRSGQYRAERDVSGRQMYVLVANGTGQFASQTNNDFMYQFGRSQYHLSRPGNMQTLSLGNFTYHYNRNEKKKAKLVLTLTSPSGAPQTFAMNMEYHSGNTGIYHARLIQGGMGSQSGIFELQ